MNRLTLDGTSGEPSVPSGHSQAVAITRLEDGRYLLFSNQTNTEGTFYVSDHAAIEETTNWIFLQRFHARDPRFYNDQSTTDCTAKATGGHCVPWQKVDPDNVSFRTDCATGEIFAIATGNTEYGDLLGYGGYNRVGVNRLIELEAPHMDLSGSGPVIQVEHLRRVNIDVDHEGTFRAAGATYVDPSGRILLYASDHSGDTFGPDEMAIDEWRTNPFTTTN